MRNEVTSDSARDLDMIVFFTFFSFKDWLEMTALGKLVALILVLSGEDFKKFPSDCLVNLAAES